MEFLKWIILMLKIIFTLILLEKYFDWLINLNRNDAARSKWYMGSINIKNTTKYNYLNWIILW